MKNIERNKAIILREKGMTINEIVARTGYSKASISVWVRNVELTDEHKKRISQKGRSLRSIELRRQARLRNEKEKRDIFMFEAKNAIKAISQKELMLIGSMLYLGEGTKKSKGSASIANGDPEVIQIMMRFFREVCKVPESKFRGHIHIHPHLNIRGAEKYWSLISGIPLSQFFKTYSKPNISSKNKRDSLPYGTFGIYVHDTKVFLTVMAWIEKIKELVLK